jgi:hypothetical protein
MTEILIAVLVILALIGMRVTHLLGKILFALEEIRENLPDRHFPDKDGAKASDASLFWREAWVSMNRLARIYEKYVLGIDQKAEFAKFTDKLNERITSRAKIENLEE